MQFYPLLPSASDIDTPIDQVNALLSQLERSIPDAIYTYELIIDLLKEQGSSVNNYRKFRSDINIFLNYIWFIKGISLEEVNRVVMREFVDYCNNPPEYLIATGRMQQHVKDGNGYISFSDKWKPFVNPTPSKAYIRKESSLKSSLSILSSMYAYLIDMEYCESNPAHCLLSKLNSTNTRVAAVDDEREKALSDNQVAAVLETAEELAKEDPAHERTLFMVNLFLHCFPRISEVSARVGFCPTMSNFRRLRNSLAYVFYIPRSKWSKSRSVSCPNELIESLKRYRIHLGLSPLPTGNEDHPLFIRLSAAQHGRDKGKIYSTLGIEQVGSIIKNLFRETVLRNTKLDEQEKNEMEHFSPHSLRHTGITLQVCSGRDLFEIAGDSGHGDLNTLSRYISKRPENRIKSAFNSRLPREYKDLMVELNVNKM